LYECQIISFEYLLPFESFWNQSVTRMRSKLEFAVAAYEYNREEWGGLDCWLKWLFKGPSCSEEKPNGILSPLSLALAR
jgi:hypothetical protein